MMSCECKDRCLLLVPVPRDLLPPDQVFLLHFLSDLESYLCHITSWTVILPLLALIILRLPSMYYEINNEV